MFWLIFLASSICFGFTIIQFIRIDLLPLCFYISISWVFGAMFTSIIIFILNFLLPLNWFLAFVTIAIQSATIYYIRIYLKKTRKQSYLNISSIRLEGPAGLYFLLAFVSVITAIHLFLCFYQFPSKIPSEASDFIDLEMSFISSVRYGINKWRRNLFLYKDPLNLNGYFVNPSLPLLFAAALDALGLDYAESTVIISFLNTVSTAVFIYHYMAYFSHHPLLCSICFMFNGSLTFFRILFGETCQNNDYVRNICYRTQVPWYSLIGSLMTFSKEFSFALPLSIISLLFAQYPNRQNAGRQYYLIAGIAAALNPSVGSSTCLFLVCSCFSKSFKYVMPFILTLIPKFFKINFQNFPIWREYQMYGIFYACIVVWFDQFGPMLISMFIPISAADDNITVHRFLAFASGFLLINLNRFGNSYFENVIAIMTVILPSICIYFVEDLNYITKFFKNQLYRGILSAIAIFIYVSFIAGGIAGIFHISDVPMKLLSAPDIDCGKWIIKNIKRYETILSEPIKHNPGSLISGRQLLCGDLNMVWKSGANVTQSLRLIRQVEITKKPKQIMNIINSNYFATIKGTLLNDLARRGRSNLVLLYENQKYEIYKIKT